MMSELGEKDPRTPTPANENGNSASKRFRVAALVVAVIGLLIATRYFDVRGVLENVLRWVQDLGFVGALVFIGLYIIATVAFIPGLILTLGAGFIYGIGYGLILSSIASTLGATAAFIAGRYLARDWVSTRISGNEKFEEIDQAVEREGWKIVFLTRLSPVFPFNLLNYAFGLTKVPLGHYFLASWIGMLPGTLMYVYFGSAAGSLATLGEREGGRSTMEWAMYGVGLIATVAVTVVVTRMARRALSKRVEIEEPAEESH